MENSVKPSFVEREIVFGRITYFINFNILYDDGWYKYDQIKIEYDRWDYGGIVDAIVTYKYPIDKMQAVINNYLLEPENEEFLTVFNEMQAWRKEAKEIAKQALDYKTA